MLRSALFLFCLLGCVFGCGPTTAPQSDTNEAKLLLERTLQTWKEGNKWQDQQTLKPPVYVTEDIWRSGGKLTEFALLDDGALQGTNVRFQVKLKSVSAVGKSAERTFYYLVTTRPALTISREEG